MNDKTKQYAIISITIISVVTCWTVLVPAIGIGCIYYLVKSEEL